MSAGPQPAALPLSYGHPQAHACGAPHAKRSAERKVSGDGFRCRPIVAAGFRCGERELSRGFRLSRSTSVVSHARAVPSDAVSRCTRLGGRAHPGPRTPRCLRSRSAGAHPKWNQCRLAVRRREFDARRAHAGPRVGKQEARDPCGTRASEDSEWSDARQARHSPGCIRSSDSWRSCCSPPHIEAAGTSAQKPVAGLALTVTRRLFTMCPGSTKWLGSCERQDG